MQSRSGGLDLATLVAEAPFVRETVDTAKTGAKHAVLQVEWI